jgi:hypothetical protein
MEAGQKRIKNAAFNQKEFTNRIDDVSTRTKV